ncbi:MAG: hypothetical protein ACR2P1_27145, partial [Pseudomonadales bacterium]
HLVLLDSELKADAVNDPAFGEWVCASDTPRAGDPCDPVIKDSCGGDAWGQCRSRIENKIACTGFGPSDGAASAGRDDNIDGGIDEPGFFKTIPSHGIFYWNSHAFNLTTQDAVHHVWRNFFFTDDLRFGQERDAYSANIYQPAGRVGPFTQQTVCNTYLMDEGDQLLELSSHTHKRGGYFSIDLPDGTRIYENFTYDDPVKQRFDPPLKFDSSDPAARTLTYCAEYTNGLRADGALDPETVKRFSRAPPNSGFGARCLPVGPTACAEGKVGTPCAGREDHASCDSSPGAGDGMCDACPISMGTTSDDEMFIPLITKLVINEDSVQAQRPAVSIVAPEADTTFSAGQSLTLQFAFSNFELVPPEDHGHDGNHDAGHNNGGHDDGGDHSSVQAGHYHLYLDAEDDAAEHETAWTESLSYTLPADLPPGEHEFRISLRAPDHHAIGAEARLRIFVE